MYVKKRSLNIVSEGKKDVSITCIKIQVGATYEEEEDVALDAGATKDTVKK